MKKDFYLKALKKSTGNKLVEIANKEHSNSPNLIPPVNETQKSLVTIFKNILNTNELGIKDNLISAGLNSLKIVQVISLVIKNMGVALSFDDLINHADIESLSKVVENKKHESVAEGNTLLLEDAESDESWSRYAAYPLSLIQQAYWAGRSSAFGLGVRTLVFAEEWHDVLDFDKLTHSINRLIGRHGVLRTVILENGEQQELNYTPLYKPRLLDLSNHEDSAKEQLVEDLRKEIVERKIDYGEWPLFDVVVVEEKKGYSLLLSIDLMLCDATSLMLLRKELWEYYASPTVVNKPLSFSFRDYVLWEEKFRNGNLYHDAKKYWQVRLDQFAAAPELPISNIENAAEPSYRNLHSNLSVSAWNTLKSIAEDYGVTPTSLLLGAFSEVLGLWSSNSKFVINLTTFNRIPVHEEINQIIGDFTGVSLLEVDARSANTFQERIKIIQNRLWEDLKHRYYSGVEVIRDLATKRGAGAARMPVVFTSMLGLENDESKGKGVDVLSSSQTAQVWIDHQVTEESGKLNYTWTIVEDLFPNGLIDEMFDYYNKFLALLSTKEYWETGDLRTDKSLESSLVVKDHHAYEGEHLLEGIWNQVNLRGDKEALVNGDIRISYHELWAISHDVSHHLDKGKSGLVGVIMEKGWEQVIGVMSTLMCGAGYVPIEWSWPNGRIKNLVEEVGLSQVITQASIYDEVRTLLDSTVKVEKIAESLLSKNHPRPSRGEWSAATDLAYIIFTSGSTGRPKGVMIEHQAVVNTIEDINRRFKIDSNDKILGVSSLSFDLSVYDIFGTFWSGGTLVLPGSTIDVEEWEFLCKKEHITLWNTVPALMELYLSNVKDTSALGFFKAILLSGDWINVQLPQRIRALNNNTQIISLGGATECSIWSVFYPITTDPSGMKSIPYGKGLSNQWLYIYNQKLEECPLWVKGDIYIGGEGLARGYWNDKEKTDNHFIIHPISKDRLYKTGDKGRYLPSGDIEFLGREDSQVKLGGYRIELGEIESILNECHEIKESVAVICGESNKRFIGAGIVLSDKQQNNIDKAGIEEIVTLHKSVENEQKIIKNDIKSTKELSIDDIGELLCVFEGHQLDDFPMPKFRYPSAGSLYSIQVYISVGESAVEGLDQGSYYYCRESNVLKRVGNNTDQGFNMFFVMYLPAATPIYGLQALDFGHIEIGHMVSLLKTSLKERGIQYGLGGDFGKERVQDSLKLDERFMVMGNVSINGNEDASGQFSLVQKLDDEQLKQYQDKHKAYELSGEETLLEFKLKRHGVRNLEECASYSLSNSYDGEKRKIYLNRQSIRHFNSGKISTNLIGKLFSGIDKMIEVLSIQVYIQPGKGEDLAGGLYVLNPAKMLLSRKNDGAEINKLYGNTNREINDGSTFTVLLNHSNTQREAALVECGIIGQLLMERASTIGVGVCPLGIDGSSKIEKDSDNEVLYSFVGGIIDQHQLNQWNPESDFSLEEDQVRKIKDYLKLYLPVYMLPSQYEVFGKLPLSSNGKVDAKVIKSSLELKTRKNKLGQTEGRDEYEIKLLAIWREILGHENLGLDDNFFERGCNSLMALRALSGIDKQMDVKLSLKEVYECGNVEKLSEVVKMVSKYKNQQEELSTDFEEILL